MIILWLKTLHSLNKCNERNPGNPIRRLRGALTDPTLTLETPQGYGGYKGVTDRNWEHCPRLANSNQQSVLLRNHHGVMTCSIKHVCSCLGQGLQGSSCRAQRPLLWTGDYINIFWTFECQCTEHDKSMRDVELSSRNRVRNDVYMFRWLHLGMNLRWMASCGSSSMSDPNHKTLDCVHERYCI